jgi:hypothetical protein
MSPEPVIQTGLIIGVFIGGVVLIGVLIVVIVVRQRSINVLNDDAFDTASVGDSFIDDDNDDDDDVMPHSRIGSTRAAVDDSFVSIEQNLNCDAWFIDPSRIELGRQVWNGGGKMCVDLISKVDWHRTF